MKKKLLLLVSLLVFFSTTHAQINRVVTNPAAEQIMLGNYDPVTYKASTIIKDPSIISKEINARVSSDSLHSYLDAMRTFKTRNSVSDTTSLIHGIGAARKWALGKFQQFSSQNENRLITSYLAFDLSFSSCPASITHHKDIFAVLPGNDTTDKSVIIIEGHIDTRCKDVCDTACIAEGMEDNASGTALVLELSRVMSKYTFDRTIVFLLTIGEEQELGGAAAFAMYCEQKKVKIKGVMNNDVIGGVICGKTSSPPSCPGIGNIDSTHVRLFSSGTFNSVHKGLARFIKLEYKEMIRPYALVPMGINIMTPEDRTGRSGDHIPFRSRSFTAMRFTSANEHGNADVSATGYTDRQHTSDDILGVDTNNDMKLDSFFVDFNYLGRNAVINGNAAAMMALGPKTPDFKLTSNNADKMYIEITAQTQYLKYRVGVRTTTNDWDSVYTFTGAGSLHDTIKFSTPNTYIVSVAAVDANGVESLFSREEMLNLVGINELSAQTNAIQLLQNAPNPFDEATTISVLINSHIEYKNAYIAIHDISGKLVEKLPIELKDGVNEVMYNHGYHMSGTFVYTLIVDGKKIESKRMIFAN
ncbi:MAG TPA: M28 family peptidase [Bacteroidia bacterium]|jgi:hypothetical protein|nr:M28 family peptidase [Bacteroidia bacterium]